MPDIIPSFSPRNVLIISHKAVDGLPSVLVLRRQ